jgi:transcriptional regulator with XRE-family HTH domain
VRVHNGEVIAADRQPGILARELGSMLQTVREITGLSYDQAAARLGCEADWLVRVETGFAVADPEQVARILTEYGVREAQAADTIIDMARRAAAPPPWLAGHTSRLTAAHRDVMLVEAEATLAQVHGFLLIPYLVQTEGYFRQIAPGLLPGCDVDLEWDLLSHRQAHRPAGVTRLLEVIIDQSALERVRRPEIMAGQLRHLLELTGSPHATVRIIPQDAVFWESRGHNFDVLSFAGTADRIGVSYYPVLGAQLASGGDAYDLWTRIENTTAAGPADSRAILERHLAALS